MAGTGKRMEKQERAMQGGAGNGRGGGEWGLVEQGWRGRNISNCRREGGHGRTCAQADMSAFAFNLYEHDEFHNSCATQIFGNMERGRLRCLRLTVEMLALQNSACDVHVLVWVSFAAHANA